MSRRLPPTILSLLNPNYCPTWSTQWRRAPIAEGEDCRGCLADCAAQRMGGRYAASKYQLKECEVRETPEGIYCAECFAALPACPVCGKEPSSHAEYPCLRCEMLARGAECEKSGGRRASPTYRGWSMAYNGKGQDNGEYRIGRGARRIHERG
jgi:hypothetical protein